MGCNGYVLNGDCFFVGGYNVFVVRSNGCKEVCPGGVVRGWEEQVDVDSLTPDAELLFLGDAEGCDGQFEIGRVSIVCRHGDG